MSKEIITDETFLKQKSIDIDIEDKKLLEQILDDLQDTAEENRDNCLGLAANQIGHLYRIFAIKLDHYYTPIINPIVKVKTGGIKSDFENCLSRTSKESIKTRRHKEIVIEYYDIDTNTIITNRFQGLQARVVQHEMDHFDGKLI